MYKVEFKIALPKLLKKIDKQEALKIVSFLKDIRLLSDPYSLAKKLEGAKDLYRYRVGNYRIICKIYNKELTILVIDIADRKNIYRKLNR